VSGVHRTLFISVLALAACGDPALESRVANLETRVKTLETAQGAGGAVKTQPTAAPTAQAQPDENDPREIAANDLFRQANELDEAGDYDGAKAKLADLDQQYGDTRAAKRAERLKSELAVIGMDAGDLKIDHWYQHQTSFDDGKATLVVFWETWCPHCQHEVPKLEDTWTKYQGKGLNIIALTKVTRTSSDDKVDQFIKDNNLTFPVAKEDSQGSMSQRFGVQGIPAAAVIKNGKVVWRGHPARLNDDLIAGWLNG